MAVLELAVMEPWEEAQALGLPLAFGDCAPVQLRLLAASVLG